MSNSTDTQPESASQVLKACVEIPFANARHARIALSTLEVDQEPRRELISKRLSLVAADPSRIRAEWSATEARLLRVSLNSFLEHLHLVVDTIQQFGDEIDVPSAQN